MVWDNIGRLETNTAGTPTNQIEQCTFDRRPRTHMKRRFLKDALGWGFVLWAIGYALGLMLLAFVHPRLVGWIITPFGTAITIWGRVQEGAGRYAYRISGSWGSRDW